MSNPAGLSGLEYLCWCELLGRPVVDVPTLNPKDRAAALPSWCVPELIATESARDRLRAWAAAGAAQPDAALVRVVAGDLEALVRRTLASLPAPVIDHLARHAFILATGREVAGWCASLPAPRTDATEGQRVLVATMPRSGADADFCSMVMHEAAHHWLEPGAPLHQVSVTAAAVHEARDNRALMLKCGVEWGLLHRLTEPAGQRERRACRLARAWGATGPAADGAFCASAVRDAIVAEAAQHFGAGA